MDIRDRRGLLAHADEALGCAPNHRRLVLLSTGAAAVVSLLVSFLNFILAGQIDQTGGLAGIGLRSALSTAQSVLSMVVSFALPFWALGYTRAMLCISRKETVSDGVLLEGFRRFKSALSLFLLQGLVYFLVCMLCVNIGSILFSMTPLAEPAYDLLVPLMSLETEEAMIEAMNALDMQVMLQAMAPMLIGCGVLCIIGCIPVFYRLRMSAYYIMDAPKGGALVAMLTSNRMMKGNCWALFRLDLHFWWFYAAEALIAGLAWCDVLLPALGIGLPFSEDVGYFLFYALSLGLQLVLYAYARNRMEVTYAKVYDTLLP